MNSIVHIQVLKKSIDICFNYLIAKTIHGEVKKNRKLKKKAKRRN